jgi:DNA-directed RNA polymerase subunit H (RpoH/RPB5)
MDYPKEKSMRSTKDQQQQKVTHKMPPKKRPISQREQKEKLLKNISIQPPKRIPTITPK